jgi:hypothetical protein
LAQNFSTTQSLADPESITITDTSTGLGAFTSRLIYLQKINGDYIVPNGTVTDFIEWAAADSSKTIEVLDRDYSLLVTTKWMNGSSIAYTKSIILSFTGYSRLFLLNLTRANAANPKLLSNQNYFTSKFTLRTLVSDADELVSLANDQEGAQLCLDMAYQLYSNPQKFY